MELVGESVCHARFGRGQIVHVEPNRITVSFQEPYGEKRFIYPDAFECFLTVEDADVCAHLAQAIAHKNEELAQKERALEERLRAFAQHTADEKARERASKLRARRTTARAK